MNPALICIFMCYFSKFANRNRKLISSFTVMKRLVCLLFVIFCLGSISQLKAQCYGNVVLDTFANAGSYNNLNKSAYLIGRDTFTITTKHCHDLIMISYNGWNGPGNGPVTVNGNPATYIKNATNGNSGTADVYAFSAGAPGTYTIICSPSGYNQYYYTDFAAAFYASGTSNPLTVASLTNFTIATIVCTTGGSMTNTITTTIANSAVYCSAEINEGQPTAYPISWTGATFLGNTHTQIGIDAGHAYLLAPTAGTYTVTETNSSPPNNGCGGLTMVLVAIPPPLCGGGGNFVVSNTYTNTTCGLCNGAANISVSGGTSPYTFDWTPNVSNDSDANNLCAGSYTVNIYDANCHDTAITFSLPSSGVALNPRDTLTTGESCFGDCNGATTMNVTGGTSPYNYIWTPGGQTTATVTGLCAGTYTFTVTDINGCSATNTATITQPAVLTATTAVKNVSCNGGSDGKASAAPAGGTSPYKYKWSDPNTQTSDTATGLSAGSYTVNITDVRGCTATAAVSLTQPTVLSVTLTGPSILCLGAQDSIQATPAGGTPGYHYTWSGVGIGTPAGNKCSVKDMNQTDTVTAFDANGCTATAAITIQLGPALKVSITGPGSICQGLSTTLCSNVTGGTGGNLYSWQPGNAQTPCANVAPSATTTYTLTVIDNCGTTTSATATLRINPLPVTAFTSSLFSGCAPLCVQFYNTTTLAQGNSSTYLWTFGNGDSSKIENPIYCYSRSGSYTIGLTVTSDSGCANSLSKISYITAFAKPNTAFTYSPQPATILNPTVQFINQSNDPYGIVSWIWNFGDGTDSVSNAASPTHTYQDTGHYCVSLTAMDIHGCSDTVTNCFVMEPNFTLYIPSAFTPNGDRKNPTFEPKGQYIKNFEMYIFDRWGMQVYHTTDITQGWDGTVNGAQAQEDTYIYRIQVTDSQNHNHTYVGQVTLLR